MTQSQNDRELAASSIVSGRDHYSAAMDEEETSLSDYHFEKAMENYNRCIEIWERLLSEGELVDENDLAMAYMGRGNVYSSVTEYEIGDAEREYFIKYNVSQSEWFNAEASVREDIRINACYDYNQCIRIWERLRSEGKPFDEKHLNDAYACLEAVK